MSLRKYFSQLTPSQRISVPLAIAITSIALALILRLTFAWISLKHLPATSDEASSVLLAKMIFQGQFPLLFIGQPYQFPFESYLMAPFVEWLPRNAFGARYQTFAFGLLSVLGFLLITRAAFREGARWPTALLILFPSAYQFLVTSAYAPPQYSMAITLSWISIFLVLRFRQTENMFFLFFTGLICGLAFSNHMLTVTISIGVFAVLLFGGNIHRDLKGTLFFGAGAVLGTTPYFLALWFEPGAYQMLPSVVSLKLALLNLMNSALTETFAGAMGANPTLFPDTENRLTWSHSWQLVFAAGYVLMVGFLCLQRSRVFCKAVLARTWPRLDLVDLALISSILTIGLFVKHFVAHIDFRYLLPAVWCFPFLIGHLYGSCRGRWNTLISIVVIGLTIFNIKASVSVIKRWNKPGLIQQYSGTPPLDSLIKVLEAKNITRCYASFWLAYRITFETDERIICALPYNQRYFYWPIPYKKEVDDASDAAYVLTTGNSFTIGNSSVLTSLFQTHLQNQDISATIDKVEPFLIYTHFSHPASLGESVLNPDAYVLRESSHSGRFHPSGERVADVSLNFPENHGDSQWLEVKFSTPHIVSSITLVNSPIPFDIKNLVNSRDPLDIKNDVRIYIRQKTGESDTWRDLADATTLSFEPLKFRNNHPVYDLFSEQIRFNPVVASGLAVELKKPYTTLLGVPKLEIFVKDSDQSSP